MSHLERGLCRDVWHFDEDDSCAESPSLCSIDYSTWRIV